MGSISSWIGDRVDLRASRSIDVSDCRSVCLTLGPYRNLTTLTASILFLRPHCQVLNRAAELVDSYRQGVAGRFGDHPKFAQGLLRFTEE